MLNVKKLSPIVAFALTAVVFPSCNQDNQHTDSVVHSKVDSIVGARMEEINRQAMDDLDQRMAIEVKQKADSIIAARLAKRDSSNRGAAPAAMPMP